MPRRLTGMRREHVEAFPVDLPERGAAPASVFLCYRALVTFFRWAVEEHEIKRTATDR